MGRMVETIAACMAGGEVIPAIGKAYLIFVEQVEEDTNIGADSRERHKIGLIILKEGIYQIEA